MKSFSPRRSRFGHARPTLVLAVLAATSLSACGGANEDGTQGAGTSEPSASAPLATPSSEQPAATGDGTPIRISSGATSIAAKLLDTATARDLAEQLPLTLTVRDHNNAEKSAPLPRELSLDGAPDG